MNPEPYDQAPIEIREDLAAAHRRALDHLARPGTWWDGAERVALMAEARHAMDCALCRERKAGLSPAAVAGSHDSLGGLPETAVEIVHRIRTDPARLTRRWYQGVIAAGLTPEQYVEIVSVVAHTVALDSFARGAGISPLPLPNPPDGTPTRHRPVGAKPGPAWVPWIEAADMTEAARATKTGGPNEADVDYGPLNNANQLTRVHGFIERLPAQPGDMPATWAR